MENEAYDVLWYDAITDADTAVPYAVVMDMIPTVDEVETVLIYLLRHAKRKDKV